jgi:DNA-binding winged helix-turn-helix (wHTH) protein/tetratricopeptide (TPR) repeat protein
MLPITYLFDDFRLDRSARELRRGAAVVTVPTRVFDCLVYLIENRDRAVGRDELVAALWGRVDVSDAQLGQIVLRARRAIGDDGNDQHCIRTMPKFGYRWLTEVRVAASEPVVADTGSITAPLDDERTDSTVAGTLTTAAGPPQPPSITPQSAPRARSVSRFLAFAVFLLVAGAAFAWIATHRAPADADRVAASAAVGAVVRPLDVATTPPQDWLRLGGMDALAARLRAGGLRVPPSEDVLAALHANIGTSDADERLRRAADADLLIDGRLDATAQGWHVALVAHPREGEVVRVETDGRDPLPTLRSAADRLLIHFGRVVPDEVGTDRTLDETLQRANAAMLANQLEVARAILLGAPALVQAEPQLRYRLAQVDFRAGDLDAVEKVLGSLLEDKPGPKDPVLRAGVLTGLGTVRLNRGDYARSEHEFGAAIAEVKDWHRPLELGQAYGGRGAALAAQGRYPEALRDLARARVELQQAGDTLGQARLDMVEGELELQRGRLETAQPVLERAVATFERFDAVNERLHTLSMLLACRERVLDHAAAFALSERAWTLRARVRDPQLRAQMLADRAELLIALGRLLEATALLDEGAHETAPQNPEYALRFARARALLALDTSRWSEVAAIAGTAVADPGNPDLAVLHAWLDMAHVRALLALGRGAEAARSHAAARVDIAAADARSNAYAMLSQAFLEAADGHDQAADASFRAASEQADAGGVADDLVTVTTAYGRWQLEHGRNGDAQATIGRVAVWADRDFRCALLQLELFHGVIASAPWFQALAQAERLAGERTIPPELRRPPGT